jgi:uncharacterized protein YjbI with pentapeptide repeats
MSKQVSTPQRPDTNDPDAWKAYWKEQGWMWRTKPEIDEERQQYLAERRVIKPDIEKGVYPFKNIKLSRADVEWLLATHENSRGPVDWDDKSQQERQGLDLRGAILNEENLSTLPLACLLGAIYTRRRFTSTGEFIFTTIEERDMAAVHLEGANLEGAHLENAKLSRGRLNRANIRRAHLESADLFFAHLEEAYFSHAHLEGASMRGCRLEGTILYKAHLAGTDLRHAIFNHDTNLEGILLWDEKHGYASLADIRWGDANLTVIDWSQVTLLGDEIKLQQYRTSHGEAKNRETQVKDHQMAIRANRQLAVQLQNQGMNEVASRFAYRAQVLQRIFLRRQKKFGQYFFSLFLDALAGYGYRPDRSVLWYLAIIISFALAYHFLGGLSLSPPDAFVFSIMSFHGRGFFPALSQETNLHNPLVMLASVEAIVGLLIEISFIATFTGRFLGR